MSLVSLDGEAVEVRRRVDGEEEAKNPKDKREARGERREAETCREFRLAKKQTFLLLLHRAVV